MGEAGPALEELLRRELDDAMVARGFLAGQVGRGPSSHVAVIYCGDTAALHAAHPDVVPAPESPGWDCFDVTIEGSTSVGLTRADLELESIAEALDRLGLADRGRSLAALPQPATAETVRRVREALEVLFPLPG